MRRVDFGDYTIGRGLTADIRLKHDSVAKQHAALRVADDDVSLRGLDSQPLLKNGMPARGQERLRVGDVFRIGECELRIVSSLIEGAPAKLANAVSVAAPARLIANDPPVAPETEGFTPPSDEIKPLQEKVQELVLRELDLFRRTALNQLASADLRDEARIAIERIISTGAIELPATIDRTQFIKEMTAEIMGFGPMEPYLSDESISEIMVNGPNCIYVERA